MNIESVTQMVKSAENPPKSQAELRTALELKLQSLKPTLEEGIKEYEQALEDDVFEDAEGEPAGTGEAKKVAMQNKLTALFDRAEKMRERLDSGEPIPQATPEISTTYTHPDGKTETITLDFEAKLTEFLSFYQKTNVDLPLDFEDTARDLWDRNQAEIEQAITQNGFEDMLIIPGNIPLADLAEKMKMESGNYTGSNFDEGGGFTGAISPNADQPRIILFHKKTLPEVQAETGLDVHLNITAGEALKLFQQKPNEHMTLPDFIIMERKIFEESGIHISDYTKKSGQWLNTKSGTRLVYSRWFPSDHQLFVNAFDLTYRIDSLGVRPARCFF
jgi:hypothetical protein